MEIVDKEKESTRFFLPFHFHTYLVFLRNFPGYYTFGSWCGFVKQVLYALCFRGSVNKHVKKNAMHFYFRASSNIFQELMKMNLTHFASLCRNIKDIRKGLKNFNLVKKFPREFIQIFFAFTFYVLHGY